MQYGVPVDSFTDRDGIPATIKRIFNDLPLNVVT